MAHFKQVTTEPPSPGMTNAVIMGRKTWDSIPPKFRPLEGRTNVVLTRSFHTEYPDGVLVASSLEDAMQQLEHLPNVGRVFVIGGAQVYEEAIQSGLVTKVIYTEVDNVDACHKFDAFFPVLSKGEWTCSPFAPEDKENTNTSSNAGGACTDSKTGMTYKFLEYQRIPKPAEGPDVNPEEMQYLEMCRDIIENGVSDTIVLLIYYATFMPLFLIHVTPSPTGQSRRQNRNRNPLQVWHPNAIFPPGWHPPSPHHQARVLARSGRRIAVVHCRQY
jgi:dihydrofolate reductase / thymidylate synthase